MSNCEGKVGLYQMPINSAFDSDSMATDGTDSKVGIPLRFQEIVQRHGEEIPSTSRSNVTLALIVLLLVMNHVIQAFFVGSIETVTEIEELVYVNGFGVIVVV